MKKHGTFFAITASLLLATGCSAGGTSSEASDAAAAVSASPALTIRAEADFVYCADTLEELYADADVILEAVVESTEAVAYVEGTDQVWTCITPQITAVYKGTYSGEALLSCGAEVDADTYRKLFPSSDGEIIALPEDGTVVYDWVGNPIVKEGDSILFFGTYDADNPQVLHNTNSFQGLYVLEDGAYTSASIEVDENGWTAPIAEDFIRLGAESEAPFRMSADAFRSAVEAVQG